MDQNISVHFFVIEPRNDAVPTFEAAIATCLALGANPGDRELELSQDDTHVRLERCNHVGDWVEGEVVRVQRDNIPLEAYPNGLLPSRAQSQGHSAVFRYNPGLRVLVIERHAVNMTTSRLLRYLRRADESARYRALPIANHGLWERYGNMRPRRFSVTMASINDPVEAEGEVGALISSGRILHEMTNAPTVRISVSAGEDGSLQKGVIGRLLDGFLGNDDPGLEITSLSVSGEDEDTDSNEVLNFLDDVLKERGELDLNGMDALASYNARIAFLRGCFAQHMDYIAHRYGP